MLIRYVGGGNDCISGVEGRAQGSRRAQHTVDLQALGMFNISKHILQNHWTYITKRHDHTISSTLKIGKISSLLDSPSSFSPKPSEELTISIVIIVYIILYICKSTIVPSIR